MQMCAQKTQTVWKSGLTALCLMTGLAFPGAGLAAGERVAIVSTISGGAQVQRDGALSELEKHSPILEDDVLITSPQGKLGIIFRDDTVFTMGPRAEVVVDRFLFDPKADAMDFSMEITKGAFTYVSGTIAKLQPEKVNLSTASATLGIRGTYLLGKVLDPRVYVYSDLANEPVEGIGGPVRALEAWDHLGGDNLFVLLEDPSGKVGKVELRHPDGDVEPVILDAERSASRYIDAKLAYAEPFQIDEEFMARNFAAVQEAQPEQPVKFTLTFETGTAVLTADSRNMLDDIVAKSRERDSHDMSVIGHADRQGDEAFNLTLSVERAQAVLAELTSRGLNRDYFEVDSHGENNPVVPTADGVAEPRNRRVEVTLR